MVKETIKSLISLLLALLPFLILGLSRHSSSILEQFRELLWTLSIPGFLYFIRYQIVRPIIRDEVMKPLKRILAICARAIRGDKDAIKKLQVIEALED